MVEPNPSLLEEVTTLLDTPTTDLSQQADLLEAAYQLIDEALR
ncbi:MAG: hypothetical protein SPI77_04715 [Corynebacterium sp.]|nr:hypothetical protein [Corynebacterium sp.]